MMVSQEVAGFQISKDDEGIVTVALNLPGKVNIMDDDFMAAMESLLARLESARDYTGIIFTSAKPVFLAGGDLKRMVQAAPGQEQELFDYFQKLKLYLRRLENLNRPVVAAINGSALGGGYETCLACHYRIALRDAKIRIGLPEIEFGILAGAGGVVRLTRLLGFEAAVPFLVNGSVVDVMSALESGLIDDLADDSSQLLEKARAWIRLNPNARQPWDRANNATPAHQLAMPVRRAMMVESAKLFKKFGDSSVAAERNLALAAESLLMDFDAALRYETRVLIKLLLSDFARSRMQEFIDKRVGADKSKKLETPAL